MMIARSLLIPNHRPASSWAAGLLYLVFLGLASVALSQPQKLTLSQIEDLVAHGVPDATLSTQVRVHGITFPVTPGALDELRAKGAGPKTLSAIDSLKPPPPIRPVPGKIGIQTEPESQVFLDGKPAGIS